jgi:hypothetical protein
MFTYGVKENFEISNASDILPSMGGGDVRDLHQLPA